MSVDSEKGLEGLRRAGRVVARALDAMKAAVTEGVSTAELDAIAAAVLAAHGGSGHDGLQRDHEPRLVRHRGPGMP